MTRTISDLVDDVYEGATTQGMDISVADTGWIISAFLEGIINDTSEPALPTPVKEYLQKIADAAAASGDET